MDITATLTAAIIHLCPFTYQGQHLNVVPLDEILQIAQQAEMQKKFGGEIDGKMGVIVSMRDCDADDGVHLPGVHSHELVR